MKIEWAHFVSEGSSRIGARVVDIILVVELAIMAYNDASCVLHGDDMACTEVLVRMCRW